MHHSSKLVIIVQAYGFTGAAAGILPRVHELLDEERHVLACKLMLASAAAGWMARLSRRRLLYLRSRHGLQGPRYTHT